MDVSVVIGFKDWGIERIRHSGQSIIEAFDGLRGELIISDYGSSDPEQARVLAKQLNAKHVYVSGDPTWSRARALNAGFAKASGELYISTDADMLFSRSSIHKIVETAREAEDCALFLQCRDLPATMDHTYFSTGKPIDWAELERQGRLRPRWGMGGMMAISSDGYRRIRGFDERLHTYGGEDLDFAQRARRAGYRTVWVDEPEVRMYHMWHPSTRSAVESTESGAAAIAFNRNILHNDSTYVRNTTTWRHPQTGNNPLVSIVYATRNRSSLLRESIISALAQTVQDFEILVVDDGPDDDTTPMMIEELADDRVRYIKQERRGISAARNLALDHTLGQFTAVMDDDDLMPPKRLEWQLQAITSDYVGSAGSFVNFDDVTGELQLIVSKVPSLAQATENGGAPGHGTWMLRTDVMRTIRYDEAIASGVDNNFFLRLLRAGYRVAHCGKPLMLRRRHSHQVTAVDSTNQENAAKMALDFLQFGLTTAQLQLNSEEARLNAWPNSGSRDDMLDLVRPFLPDQLVRRDLTAHVNGPLPHSDDFDGASGLHRLYNGSRLVSSYLTIEGASYPDLAKISKLGYEFTVSVATPDLAHPKPASQWLELAIKDFVSHNNADRPTLVFASETSQTSESAMMSTYVYETEESSSTVNLTDIWPDKSSQARPWVVVGQSIEELWT